MFGRIKSGGEYRHLLLTNLSTHSGLECNTVFDLLNSEWQSRGFTIYIINYMVFVDSYKHSSSSLLKFQMYLVVKVEIPLPLIQAGVTNVVIKQKRGSVWDFAET